jgi:2-haloacid dehalogenase
VAIMRELKDQGVALYALSNFNDETFAIIEPRHEFFAWFDGTVISGREGIVKPDPAIFRLLQDRFGLAPADAVFVDDSPVNVEAAMRCGFDGIVFSSVDELRSGLMRRGLLPANGHPHAK